MQRKITVALIAGGRSGERQVSLNGASEVYQALDKEKYTIRQYDPATDMAKIAVDAGLIDMAFILLHGPFGEDGTMQGFLDLLAIPYQGAGVLGSALAMDKNLAKILYRQAGLKVPAWRMMDSIKMPSPEELEKELGLPLVIKPVGQGSSLGMSIPKTIEALRQGLDRAFNYGREVMVEKFIKGREITGGVIGNDELTALPLVEIIPSAQYDFFDYEAKYKTGASREICPAPLPENITEKARQIALTAHRTLHLRGYSRTDMMVAEDGSIYVLETNTIPGMTPTSLLPQAAAAAGLPFANLLDRLIELALEDRQK
ncbi:MAG: D-alanine--D-alanine ligase [Deltaproteobacteria bacterium]